MKHSFTLIELLVVTIIIAILASTATPTFSKYILKARAEEAKVAILAIVFAQKRYYQEMGSYYPSSLNNEIKNEDTISTDLKVDLSASNNFIYTVKRENVNSVENYTIKAIMRRDKELCSDITNPSDETFCKQSGTENIDNWANGIFDESNKYIIFRYPTKLSSDFVEEGIDYEKLFD